MYPAYIRDSLADILVWSREHPDWRPVQIAFSLSYFILRRVADENWAKQHVFQDGFLWRASDPTESEFRVIELGEMLFNLCLLPGVDRVVGDLKKKGNIEAIFAELEAAKMLLNHGCAVRFNEPRGQRGADYDLEVLTPAGVIAVEAKCRMEASDVTRFAMETLLRSKRGQLPKDRPGAFIVKLPQRFSGGDSRVSEFLEATKGCKEYLKSTEGVT